YQAFQSCESYCAQACSWGSLRAACQGYLAKGSQGSAKSLSATEGVHAKRTYDKGKMYTCKGCFFSGHMNLQSYQQSLLQLKLVVWHDSGCRKLHAHLVHDGH
ncbi:hypothetical protein L7F22_054701, partial [Adiantum nelumboides]|nr:hypothetical protein [Adiantum nelumboides]